MDLIQPWMGFYFEAKRELNTCTGMDGQITWTAIREYAATYDLDVDQFDDLRSYIRAMEEGVRESMKEIEEAKKKNEGGKDKPS